MGPGGTAVGRPKRRWRGKAIASSVLALSGAIFALALPAGAWASGTPGGAGFDLAKHLLTVSTTGSGSGTVSSAPAGISCPGACQAEFEDGATVTLTGFPASGVEPVEWVGCPHITPENRCVVTMNVAWSVTAAFNPKQPLGVTVAGSGAVGASVSSNPGGISCPSACQGTYDLGEVVVLSGTPGIHTEAPVWSGCTHVVGADECEVKVEGAGSVTATFDLQPGHSLFTVSVERTGTGEGTVAGSIGGLLCGSVCSTPAIEGQSLTLTATPAAGSVFAHWGGGGCSGTAPCTTIVKSSKTVKALFTAVGTRTLTVSKAGSGKGTVTAKAAGIECGSACSAQIAVGKTVTLSAAAADGSAFAHWSGACSGTAKTCKVKMSEARQATATFNSTAGPAAAPKCVVPRLAGKSLRKAKAALAAAHCSLGKVQRPKARKGRLRVKASSPPAGATLPAGSKVGLKLGVRPKRRR